MCSQIPDTTIPIANPEKPLTKRASNVAKANRSKWCTSMVLGPQESEQRLHGVTHWTGRLRGPRVTTLDQRPETFNEQRREIWRACLLPHCLERVRPRHCPGVAET